MKKSTVSDSMCVESNDGQQYITSLAAALNADLSEIQARDVCRVWSQGTDTEGLPAVVLTPSNLGPSGWDDALQFFIRECDDVAKSQYRIVLVNSGYSMGFSLAFWAARRARAVLPRRYRKNLAAVSVVHPSTFIRVCMYLLKPFVSSKFWSKIQFADRIEELALDGTFSAEDLPTLLPELCRDFELQLESDAAIMRQMAREKGFGGIDPREDSIPMR